MKLILLSYKAEGNNVIIHRNLDSVLIQSSVSVKKVINYEMTSKTVLQKTIVSFNSVFEVFWTQVFVFSSSAVKLIIFSEY